MTKNQTAAEPDAIVVGRRKLLRRQAAASFLGVSVPRFYALARAGCLPIVRLGGQVFLDSSRVEAFLDSGGSGLPRNQAVTDGLDVETLRPDGERGDP